MSILGGILSPDKDIEEIKPKIYIIFFQKGSELDWKGPFKITAHLTNL